MANTTAPVSGLSADCPALALDGGRGRGDDVVTVSFVGAGQKADFSRFNVPSGSDEIISEGWSQYEIERTMAALATISNYIDITFEFTTAANADFQMVLDSNEFSSRGSLGYFFLPGGSSYTGESMGAFNKNGYGWSTDGLRDGGLGFSTILHEALHGLGLEHPHDGANILPGLDPDASNYPFGDLGDFGLNQEVYTIMSYNSGLTGTPRNQTMGNAATPMALDIALLQEIYGANTTHESGDSVYELSDSHGAWSAIWDTGGTDTISYNGSRDVNIDLREATLQQEAGGGGFISATQGIGGGFTIANGADIENASGGSGDDTVTGNDLGNALDGNAGDDDIDSGAGNDTVDGNSGADDIETVSGANTIYGSSGFDDIQGGSGIDTIFGGSGDDQINGGNGNDNLFGGRGDDDISGGGGSDRITGGMGADELTGGNGADDFIFEFTSDSLTGAGNRDTITDFQVGTDDIDLTNFGGLSFAGDITLNVSGGNTLVRIDTNGDNTIDMEIFLDGTTGLTASDFLL